jgi:cytochrome c oxidase assembly protein subunit 15
MTVPGAGSASPWRHRFAIFTAACTLALIFVGGLVTSTGSGLAVPDWPLSYGMLMPPMVGGVFYEHGHRMAATFVGLLTTILAFWTARSEPRAGVRRLAWVALATVIAQGILGGITVKFLLPTPVSVAHACLAQSFFCLTIALAYVTSREFAAAAPLAANEDRSGVRGAAALATGVVFAQLAVGAVMRHMGAGLAIPDFPLAAGRLIPPFDTAGVAVHFAHRVGAVLVLAAVARLALRARRSGSPRLSLAAWLALSLVVVQVGLGAATVLSGRAVVPTTAHVAVGAAVLGACWLATLRAFRLLRRPHGVAAAAPRVGVAVTP